MEDYGVRRIVLGMDREGRSDEYHGLLLPCNFTSMYSALKPVGLKLGCCPSCALVRFGAGIAVAKGKASDSRTDEAVLESVE